MTTACVRKNDYGGPIPSPDDYDNDALPLWVRGEWWAGGESVESQAAWATLDIELAYPSVRLDRLERSGIAMLTDDLRPVSPQLIGYPQSVRQIMHDPDCRRWLVQSLVEALDAKVHSDSIPRCSWRPHHAAADLPPDNKGLPTGLAVSGILLNVVLHGTDRSVLRHLNRQSAEHRGAFVRFADDMIVLSRSAYGLMDLIEAVWRGLSDDEDSTLAASKSASNLYLGAEKVSPQPVRDLVRRYRRDHGWTECPVRGCEQLRRPRRPRSPQSLSEWWEERVAENPGEEYVVLGRNIVRTIVGPEGVGPFITTLVARMSDIARDTLSERFGEGARNRLIQLHDLARLDIDDLQVRADTRRAFAVNRLVRAWLPANAGDVDVQIAAIRESIAQAFQVTPWKHSMWRAIVQAAARRPPASLSQGPKGDDDAARWLSTQLQRIAYHAAVPNDERTSWMHTWPERGENTGHDRDPGWRQLYLSFHRTAFWQALGNVLRTLWQHEYRLRRAHAGRGTPPPPHWWTVRAIPDGRHADVVGFLGTLDSWVNVLYRGDSIPELAKWTWELDQLVAAVVASRPAAEVAEAWRRSERPGRELMVPEAGFASVEALQRTMSILGDCRRVSPRRSWAHRLNEDALAHVRLAGRDDDVGELLFPEGREPRILGWRRDATHTLMTGMALGCRENVSIELARDVLRLTGGPRMAHRDSLTLREYGSARRIVLGSGELP